MRQKCRQIDDDFDCQHAAGAIQCDAHHPMECIRDFMQSHYMLPSGECPHNIALMAAKVDEFVETAQKTNKHSF